MAVTFRSDFRRFFIRGLAATLPTLLTVAIIVYLFNFIQNRIGDPINGLVIHLLNPLIESMDRQQLDDFWQARWYLRAVGFVVAVVGVYLIGRLVASFVGRSVWRMIEQALTRTPLIKQIYPSVKQVTDFLLSEKRFEFSRVVAVEYPRKGIWSLALVTGSGLGTLRRTVGSDLLTVFIPSSPTPVTGYTITVRRDEVIDLPLTLDEALRFTVSGGVLMPPFRPALGGGQVAPAGGAPEPGVEDAAGAADRAETQTEQEKDT